LLLLLFVVVVCCLLLLLLLLLFILTFAFQNPAFICLAFVDTSTGNWTCVDTNLTGTGTYRIGTTPHFTSFGVLLDGSTGPSGSTAGGDGGGGFNDVYIAPIVISICFAIFVVGTAIVIGLVVGIYLRRKRRRKLQGLSRRDALSGEPQNDNL